MALVKCPRCELNYMNEGEKMCSVCRKELHGDSEQYDVIVTDNLFGDLVTDLAAVVTGGIGLAASGNINVEGTAPSLFEPIHGSAPDIAGQGKADPTASIQIGRAHV